ncbi:conjugative transposon protein TraM [Salinimicrobium sp. CAU 1759]|jgi:hypothetical protein
MKVEKNKIVFASVIVIVIIFLVAYSSLVLMGEEEPADNLKQPVVPALKEEKANYNSKMDALNDLKEVRKSNAPSIYSEKLLDSMGIYDPFLEEKKKEQTVDSIYNWGRIDYEEGRYRDEYYEPETVEEASEEIKTRKPMNSAVEFAEAHRDFFNAAPISPPVPEEIPAANPEISAAVNGGQQVRINDRLELILTSDATINDLHFPKNTLLYGFISFQPNRVMIKITHINNTPVKLKAFDLQDGNEGIYVENSFRSEATREVLDDVIQDINIAGLPQIGGIKNIFRRNNRNVKVTVIDQYQLILKP